MVEENCLKRGLWHENQGKLRETGGDSSDCLLVQMKVSGPVCMYISTGPQDKSRYSVTMMKGAV